MLIGELIKQLGVFGEGRVIHLAVLDDDDGETVHSSDIECVVETEDGIYIQSFTEYVLKGKVEEEDDEE